MYSFCSPSGSWRTLLSVQGLECLVMKASNSRIPEGFLILIFAIYMLSVFLITFSLPSDILDDSILLRNVVDAFSQIIPSIERTGARSHVPQVAKTILVYEIIWMPILGYLFVRYTPIENSIIKSRKHPFRFYVLTPLVVALLIWGLFFFFPGNPGGAWSSRIERSMLTTYVGLAGWSGFLFGGGGAGLVFFTILYIKILPRMRK